MRGGENCQGIAFDYFYRVLVSRSFSSLYAVWDDELTSV